MLIDAAIFDFDETMIDLEREHAAASDAFCRELGADYYQLPESIRLASGRRILDEVREMRAFFGWTESEDELMTRRQRHFDEVARNADLHLLPGVERTVKALHAKGITLAITSSAVGASIELILRKLGLREYFALIVDGSDVQHGKPDPEAYVITVQRLGTRECVVFEDSTVGVASAKAAGLFCIAIRNARAHVRQDLSKADMVLGSFEDLDLSLFALRRAR